ncbi:MAG: Lrp/AsnC ligand binding domain-containing protein, partial [Lentisphaeria bacterium]
EPSLLNSKAQEISQLSNVLSASIVSGRYDILIEVLVESNSGLVKFLTTELATVKGLTTSESFVFLRSYNKYV